MKGLLLTIMLSFVINDPAPDPQDIHLHFHKGKGGYGETEGLPSSDQSSTRQGRPGDFVWKGPSDGNQQKSIDGKPREQTFINSLGLTRPSLEQNQLACRGGILNLDRGLPKCIPTRRPPTQAPAPTCRPACRGPLKCRGLTGQCC
eukprot:TRINITY_DN2342_c0_g1_i6.p1 TRINITY_DN2342_c0_g1~~TRINITY_DN2342_c0_g1_i6.p1  ORF type:complete len:146 (+),score=17.96 TRINITY_DN2342_c0_g1_i6:122-559(+)